MRGQSFSILEETVDAFGMHVLEIPQSDWQKFFDNWIKGMQKCVVMGNILKNNKAIFDD